VLDTRNVMSFSGGQYLVWNVVGHVVFQITAVSGPNAVVSGIFFAPTGVSVSVTPSSVTLKASGQQVFTATVTGSANQSVTWSISPNVGTMLNGTYTAPASIAAPQVVTVAAQSAADATAQGTATVNLQSPSTGSQAQFVVMDSTTKGSWKGFYGADGANVIGDTANYPSYAAITPHNQILYTWASSTTGVRALQ